MRETLNTRHNRSHGEYIASVPYSPGAAKRAGRSARDYIARIEVSRDNTTVQTRDISPRYSGGRRLEKRADVTSRSLPGILDTG